MIHETERLILRNFDPELDAQTLFDLNSDPDVIRYVGEGNTASVEEMRKFIEAYPESNYAAYGMGRWMAIRKEGDEPIGWIGLKYHPQTKLIDLGYRLFRKHWGKGYATEGSIYSLNHGFVDLELNHIYAEAAKENPASISVMKKVGMTFWKESEFDGLDSVVYQMFRKEWIEDKRSNNLDKWAPDNC